MSGTGPNRTELGEKPFRSSLLAYENRMLPDRTKPTNGAQERHQTEVVKSLSALRVF